ncbi:hypothetical protein [Klebsiella grimontii]|uniref:hypothetical protein n=1 Tax=Klebsiella grimontii TaxID=2058152 RepID=UPI001D9A0477|nr:hypothetical protein [Klebsiella michiganensis]
MKIRHVVVQSADCRHLGSSSCTMAICVARLPVEVTEEVKAASAALSERIMGG